MAAIVRLLAAFLAALALGGTAEMARVPTGVSSIRVRSASGITATVTRPTAVRQIVKWFDALPRFRPLPCPYQLRTPPSVKLVFRDAGGSTLLHATDHEPGICGSWVTYGNDGQVRYSELADDGFVTKVSQLLGVNFAARSRTATNEHAAKRDAARLLRLAILPPGSRRVTKSATTPGTTPRVDIHANWKVRLPLDSVDAFETAHRPRGSQQTESGTGSRWSVITSKNVTFSFPRLAGISSREVVVTMTRLRNGWTAIRVDAEDTWIVARPPSEVVPAGVVEVDVNSHHVTDRPNVAKIVRWFDALPIVQPGAGFSCPMLVYGPVVALDFRGADGALLAHARMEMRFNGGSLFSTRCTSIRFSIGGKAQTPLVGGRFFVRVERLLGVKLR